MKYKILVIDQSNLLRNFIRDKLTNLNFEVLLAKDGLDGLIKMRNQLPDLIIMDIYLPRLNGLNFLKEKSELKGTKDIPVVLLSPKIDRDIIIKLSKYKINKILSKPIQIDLLLLTISNIFNVQFEIDKTQCKIDVHLNDDILFIEVSMGLNSDKIELMKYKILEVKDLYETELQKVLIIMTDIEDQKNLDDLLNLLMQSITSTTSAQLHNINLLTRLPHIKSYFTDHSKYNKIKISEDFIKAIENLGKIDLFFTNESEIESVKKNIISKKIDKPLGELDLNFSDETIKLNDFENDSATTEKKFTIAIVDDDLSILELMEEILTNKNWKTVSYENGKIFIDDYNRTKPDLIFLDILMPIMSGFDVLDYLKTHNNNIPVIVLTALADKDSILKARQYGVKSYMTKPANIKFIQHKVEEILISNF